MHKKFPSFFRKYFALNINTEKQFEACKLTLSIETFKPQCKKSHSETCNENHAEKTECQTLTPIQCVEIPFEGASTLFMYIIAFSRDIYSFGWLVRHRGGVWPGKNHQYFKKHKLNIVFKIFFLFNILVQKIHSDIKMLYNYVIINMHRIFRQK